MITNLAERLVRRLWPDGFVSVVVAFITLAAAAPAPVGLPPAFYAAWRNGPSADPNFFPIAVWLQDPKNADRYKTAGFNTYVGLWEGPTEEQLATLKKFGLRVICEQNAVALRHLDDPTICAWMHGDEPDNAQELPDKQGYGPPVAPEKITADYDRIKQADPSRPVMLNLGQGVAWDGWYGRGVRSNHPEDYPLYLKGADIASFDIYPVNHDRAEIANKLWFVAHGVDRLVDWGADKKITWNCIECTRIGDVDRKPTPAQVKAEVWMSLIHGSQGLIYFVHQFKPTFREAALFDDAAMLAGVTVLNKQIQSLAPALNSPTVHGAATVKSSNPDVPVDILVKREGGATYIFAVAMRDAETVATITLTNAAGSQKVEVLGEGRAPEMTTGVLSDQFAPWAVHLYRITDPLAKP